MEKTTYTTKAQKRHIFGLFHSLNMIEDRDIIVYQFTNNRTGHVSQMKVEEAQKLISFLELKVKELERPAIDWAMGKIGLELPKQSSLSPKEGTITKKYNNDEKAVKMRKKILHLLALYGMTTEGGALDYKRINEFIMNIGSRNPDKKGLNFLTNTELNQIITQIEQILYKPNKKC